MFAVRSLDAARKHGLQKLGETLSRLLAEADALAFPHAAKRSGAVAEHDQQWSRSGALGQTGPAPDRLLEMVIPVFGRYGDVLGDGVIDLHDVVRSGQRAGALA